MDRAAKKEHVAALNSTFKSTGVAVVAHYSGLTVAQMQILRAQMKLTIDASDPAAVDAAWDRVVAGDVRYRCVIDTATIPG